MSEKIRNKIIGQNACIGEQDLRDLEREYNFKFPEDIKQFYLKYNGGRLEKYSYAAHNDTFIPASNESSAVLARA